MCGTHTYGPNMCIIAKDKKLIFFGMPVQYLDLYRQTKRYNTHDFNIQQKSYTLKTKF